MVITFIIDTGAGICLISEAMLQKLGWSIDAASECVLKVADGKESPILGIIKNVPVTFGSCTFSVDMIVTESTSYDVILGTNWLHLADAEVRVKEQWMTFIYHGQKHKIPIDTNRGTRSNMINSDVESSDQFEGNWDERKPVYTVLDYDEPLERRAQNWRAFTNKADQKNTRRYPAYRGPRNNRSTHQAQTPRHNLETRVCAAE
jgi:hypothetical protein